VSANPRIVSSMPSTTNTTMTEPAAAPAPRIYLQPIAPPSILGLYGFAGATFMVSAILAHWFGNQNTQLVVAPFALVFGGLAQFLAGMWAFKARDGLATAMHGMWGSFWIAYGILMILFANHTLQMSPNGLSQGFGFWFIVLAVITWTGAYAATAENWGLTSVLVFLAAGSTLFAIANFVGSSGIEAAAGWAFFISSVCAWYTASALMFRGSFGRDILPLGMTQHAKEKPELAAGYGEPGVFHGQ